MKRYLFIFLFLTCIPLTAGRLTSKRGEVTSAQKLLVPEIPLPLYGNVKLPDPATPGGPQEATLPDKSYGPLQLTQGRVSKVGTTATVTTRVSFAGVELQAEGVKDENQDASLLDLTLKSLDGNPVKILDITFENAKLRIEQAFEVTPLMLQEDPELSPWAIQLSGTIKLLDLIFNAGFNISTGKSVQALFFAELSPEIKTWKPFAGTGISTLEAITVTDLKAGLRGSVNLSAVGQSIKSSVKSKFAKKEDPKAQSAGQATSSAQSSPAEQAAQNTQKSGVDLAKSSEPGGLLGSLYITGSSTILNVTSQVAFDLGYQQGGWQITGLARLPNGWKLSQSFPELFAQKNPVNEALDLLKITEAQVIISTRSGQVSVNNQILNVEKGLTLSAGISIDEKYDNDILKFINSVVRGFSKEGDRAAGLKLRGTIPPSIKNLRLQVGLSTGDVALAVGPAKFYGGGLDLIVRGEPSIGFGGSFKFKPTDKDEPVSFDLEFEFTPIKFGVAGIMLGLWKNPFGIRGFQFGNLGLRGTQSYEALGAAVAAAAATAGVGSLTILIPADAGLAGEVVFGEGQEALNASLRMNLGKDVSSIGVIAEVKTPVTLSHLAGVLLKQMGLPVPPFKDILPFDLRNVKVQFVPLGTTIGELQLEQGIGFSACMVIFGKLGCIEAAFDLSRGVVAKGSIDALEIGALKVTGANGKGNPTLNIELGLPKQVVQISGQVTIADIFKSNTDIMLSPQGMNFTLESFLGTPEGRITTVVKGSTGSILDITKALEPGQVKLDIDFKNDLTTMINKKIESFITERKETFENDINKAIEQVVRLSTQEDIKRQEAALEYAKSRRVMFKDDPVLSIAREADVTKEQSSLDLLKLKYNIEQTEFGKAIRKFMDDLGISKALEKVLTDVRKAGSGLFEQGRFAFNRIANLAVVKRVSWSGGLSDIKDGILKGVMVEVELSGQLTKRNLGDLNLKDPASSINNMAQQIAGLAIDAIKASVGGVVARNMCDMLEQHNAYWKENGPVDPAGARYDGDSSRGQWLLSQCQKENPAIAATLQAQMLPASGCFELKRHVDFSASKGINADPVRSGRLWSECAAVDIDQARQLMLQLPGAGCFEFNRHANWVLGGNFDDKVRGNMLYNQCMAENPPFARQLAAKLPGYPGYQAPAPAPAPAAPSTAAGDRFEEHVNYWAKEGRDGNPAQTVQLWSAAAAENIDRARSLMLRMPGAGCFELKRHADYKDATGKDDRVRGNMLYGQCQAENPAVAQQLAQRLGY